MGRSGVMTQLTKCPLCKHKDQRLILKMQSPEERKTGRSWCLLAPLSSYLANFGLVRDTASKKVRWTVRVSRSEAEGGQ